MKCKNCQTEINEGANFCFNCGSSINENKSEEGQYGSILNSDIETDIEGTKNWYKKYFEYIGRFENGFAPVIDNINNPQSVGYVSDDIPVKLKSKDLEKISISPQSYILYHFNINKNILEHHQNIIWVGEFNNDKALIASDEKIYTIDINGNMELSGSIIHTQGLKQNKCFIAINEGLYGKVSKNNNHCIVDYSGNFIRNNNEYMDPLGTDDFALFSKINNDKKGLLKISNGKQLLDDKYDDLRNEYKTLPDGTRQWVIISEVRNGKGTFQGCLNPYKGWIFKTKYPSIDFIDDNNLQAGRLLVCLNEIKENEYETFYEMGIADLNGDLLFEYSSYEKEYEIIDGEICVYISNKKDISLVSIDNTVIISLPNTRKASYLGEGYFKVVNHKGQYGVINRNREFSIPYGQFDKIDSFRIFNGGLKVAKDNLWGFSDVNGQILIPLMYKSIRDEYSLSERPEILVWPDHDNMGWFYINYKNETDGGIPVEEHIRNGIKTP